MENVKREESTCRSLVLGMVEGDGVGAQLGRPRISLGILGLDEKTVGGGRAQVGHREGRRVTRHLHHRLVVPVGLQYLLSKIGRCLKVLLVYKYEYLLVNLEFFFKFLFVYVDLCDAEILGHECI